MILCEIRMQIYTVFHKIIIEDFIFGIRLEKLKKSV